MKCPWTIKMHLKALYGDENKPQKHHAGYPFTESSKGSLNTKQERIQLARTPR
jgi:hypothetical protein